MDQEYRRRNRSRRARGDHGSGGNGSRSEGRRSPSKADKARPPSSKGKRDLNSLSRHDTLGDEAYFEIEDLRREFLRMERENERLTQVVADLDSDNEYLQELLDEQESQIRTMQEQRFAEFGTGRGFMRAEDDETVRWKIQSCMKSLRSWATKYAVSHRKDIKETDEPVVRELFREVSNHSAVSDGILHPQNDAIAPGIVLNALLAKFVTDNFQRPFFCLRAISTSRDESFSNSAYISQAFHSVYQKAQLQGKICFDDLRFG